MRVERRSQRLQGRRLLGDCQSRSATGAEAWTYIQSRISKDTCAHTGICQDGFGQRSKQVGSWDGQWPKAGRDGISRLRLRWALGYYYVLPYGTRYVLSLPSVVRGPKSVVRSQYTLQALGLYKAGHQVMLLGSSSARKSLGSFLIWEFWVVHCLCQEMDLICNIRNGFPLLQPSIASMMTIFCPLLDPHYYVIYVLKKTTSALWKQLWTPDCRLDLSGDLPLIR